MENTSFVEGLESEDGRFTDILLVCEVFNGVGLSATVWIFMCSIVYGVKRKKWKPRNEQGTITGRMIYTTCVVATALTLPRQILNQVNFRLAGIFGARALCETVVDLTDIAHFLAVYAIFFFLWVRQRALYQHVGIRCMIGRKTSILSKFSIIWITLASLAVALMLVIPEKHAASPHGCIVKLVSREQSVITQVTYCVAAFFMIAIQITLLVLFIIPMSKQQRIRHRMNNEVRKDSSGGTRTCLSTLCSGAPCMMSRNKDGEDSWTLERIVRRSVLATLVAAATDLVALVIDGTAFPEDIPRPVPDTFYNIGIVVNVFCMFATFGSITRITCVFCRWQKMKDSQDSTTEVPITPC